MRVIKQGVIHLLLASLLFAPIGVFADEVTDLQKQIKDREARIEALKKQAQQYQASLEQKRKERVTLSSQISILVDRIDAARVDIATIETTIDATTLHIRELEHNIRNREAELKEYRRELSGLVRWTAHSQNQSALKIFFTSPSFASFSNQMKNLKSVQMSMTDLIADVDATRVALASDKQSLEGKRKELVSDVEELNTQRLSLEAQEETKSYLLEQTKSSEEKFAALLEDARREQAAANQEIAQLEQTIRNRLKDKGLGAGSAAPSTFVWPVPNTRGISSPFHDQDYPFRRVFEHTGIDIRAAQGTPIRASASGYVGRAKNGGAKGYSYILIVHSGGLATVYGHVSQILVNQDTYVTQGQVIGRSGGMPGTPGAGPFSTGAHLHFEVRKDGIPVNPRPFLP